MSTKKIMLNELRSLVKQIINEEDKNSTPLQKVATELYNAAESVRKAIKAIEVLDSLPENDPQNPNQDKRKYINDLKKIETELDYLRSWVVGVLPYGKKI